MYRKISVGKNGNKKISGFLTKRWGRFLDTRWYGIGSGVGTRWPLVEAIQTAWVYVS